jgi:MoxR-like ATPase
MFTLPAQLHNPLFANLVRQVEGAGFGSMRDDVGLVLMCNFAGYTDHRIRQPNAHVLLEGLNGVGKTSVVSAVVDALLGEALSAFYALTDWRKYSRSAGSPDQAPADLIGFDQPGFDKDGKPCLRLVPGPLLEDKLAHYNDEQNRSPPKAQSVWLEPMAEVGGGFGPVTLTTLDPQYRFNRTWKLRDFWLIASQNPVEQEGTFPLPEAMADRFMVKITTRYSSQLAGMIDDRGYDRPAGRRAGGGQRLKAALEHAEFTASLAALAGHEDLLGDAGLCSAGGTVSLKPLGGPAGMADTCRQPIAAEADFQSVQAVERLLLAARRAVLRGYREEVRQMPFSGEVAKYAAGLVYDTWTNQAYRSAVGGGGDPPFKIDPGVESLIGDDVAAGASPRAAIALRCLSKSYAWAVRGPGSGPVTEEDVTEVAPMVLRHRILLRVQAAMKQRTADDVIQEILKYRRVNRHRPDHSGGGQ